VALFERKIEIMFLVILLFLATSVSAQVIEQKGELRLYYRATQIGTTGNREFKDNKGRVVKTIYYTGGSAQGSDSIAGPYFEELLHEQSIHLYTYDDHDCRTKSMTYLPGMKLTRTTEVRCLDGTKTPQFSTVRDERGVKISEEIHTANGGTGTVLHFDSGGETVIAFSGETPTGVDLPHGWGKEVSGFASGIAASRDKGPQKDLRVSVTIKNISGRSKADLMVSLVKVELKDSAARLFEPKPNQNVGVRTEECVGGFGVPAIGISQWLPGFDLGEQYDPLAPGRYSLTVTHCLSANRGLLISNTIFLEVEGKANSDKSERTGNPQR